MATRRGRLGKDDPLSIAKRALEAENIAWSRHITHCGRCFRAKERTALYCDTGWELAKVRARAAGELRKLEAARFAGYRQDALW